MSPGMHRIAGGGNVAVLAALGLILASSRMIFFPPVPSTQSELPDAAGKAAIAVLVVLDGLRADVAIDVRVMPEFCRLGRRGGRGTARVECLIPSTVAGVTTMATGQIAAPVSFLQDFSAAPSGDGGVFAAIAARGERSAVAGPDVWLEKFGRWAVDCTEWANFTEQNQARLEGGLKALGSRRDRLIVFHFDQADTAEHRFSPESSHYREAARQCDEMLGRIVRALPGDACLIATADHGAANGGGHGGPETEVLTVPVAMIGAGLPTGRLPPLKQRDIPRLLCHALGLPLPPVDVIKSPSGRLDRWLDAVAIVVLAGCAWPLIASLTGGVRSRQHFFLSLTLWFAIAMACLGFYRAALAFIATAFAMTALAAAKGLARGAAWAMVAGAIFGGWRLLDAAFHVKYGANLLTQRSPASVAMFIPLCTIVAWETLGMARDAKTHDRTEAPWRTWLMLGIVAGSGEIAGGTGLAAVSTIVCLVGQQFANSVARNDRPSTAVFAGAASVMVPVFALRCLGQTISLSAIDVREAFAWAWVSGGLTVSILIVILTLALPTLAFWLPWRATFDRFSPCVMGGLSAGAAAALAAQAVIPTLVLRLRNSNQILRALILDVQIRVLAESIMAFLALAAIYGLRRRYPFRRLARECCVLPV